MDISVLEVFKSPVPKKRLGRNNDGGYVICDNYGPYDFFISGGVADDISFEEHFLREYPYLKCIAFDGNNNDIPNPQTTRDITYIHKNIENSEDDSTTNLHEYLETYKNIFIKMDIEGSEFPWINSLSIKQLRSIKQLVIEIHHPMTSEAVWSMLKKLAHTHWLVHLHPHNGCGYVEATFIHESKQHNTKIPRVFECTYIRKDYLEPNDEPVPSALDQSNSPQVKDIMVLSGYPYTSYVSDCVSDCVDDEVTLEKLLETGQVVKF